MRPDYTVISIPGRDEQDPALWFIYDRANRREVCQCASLAAAQARRDALQTAECHLAEEWNALDILATRGLREGTDARFCRSEIARLQSLITRLKGRN